METVKKCVILCGGYATRFMPQCKCVPKELLPLYNTPILQHLVDDLVNNGVSEICFVIRKGKEIITEHFKSNKKWEKSVGKGVSALFSKYKNVKFYRVFQKRPNGTGDALLCAKKFCTQPFYLLNGDEIIYNSFSLISQLKFAYEKQNTCVIGVKKVQKSEAHKYGMISYVRKKGEMKLTGIVEKPDKDEIPSLYSNLGAFVLKPNFLSYITPNKRGQVPITDALNSYVKKGNPFTATEISGIRFDMGNPLSYVLSNVNYCYHLPETHEETKKYLKTLLKE